MSVEERESNADVWQRIAEQIAEQGERFVSANTQPAKRSLWAHAGAIFLGTIPVLLAVVSLTLQVPAVLNTVNASLSSLTPNEQNVPLARERLGAPTASSYRQDVDNPSVFFPLFALDGDKATPWVECQGGTPVNDGGTRMLGSSCAPHNHGIGEYLELPLTEPTDLKAIRIRNGYQKRNDLYFRNSRVKELIVRVFQGSAPTSRSFLLTDEPDYQTLPLVVNGVTRIRLTIGSVYPGEKFLGEEAFSDTAIADVQIIPARVPR